MRMLLPIAAIYAASGFILSTIVNLLVLAGWTFEESPLSTGLLIGVFPLWFLVTRFSMKSINAERLYARGGYWRHWNWKTLLGGGQILDAFFSGCPAWMKYGYRALHTYGLLALVAVILMAFSMPLQDAFPRAFTWLSTAYAMLFYFAGLGMTVTALRTGIENLEPRCLNRHPIAAGDRYCPTCGVPIGVQ